MGCVQVTLLGQFMGEAAFCWLQDDRMNESKEHACVYLLCVTSATRRSLNHTLCHARNWWLECDEIRIVER